jgi:hypothetical protein
MVARCGRQCGVVVHPHRFRHHFSHTWLDRGGAGADLVELNGWSSRRCCAATAPVPAAPAPAAVTTASWTCPEAQTVTRPVQLMQPAMRTGGSRAYPRTLIWVLLRALTCSHA